MGLTKAVLRGSPHLGVFCAANDNHAFVPLSAPKSFDDRLRESLGVDVVRTTMMNSNLIGTFVACNSRIAFLPADAEKRELNAFKEAFGEVVLVGGGFNALGNLISMNDSGIACSPAIIREVAGSVECEPARIAGSDLTGSAVFATNAGFLCHHDATQAEVEKLESLFKSKGNIGTVNFGDPFVRSGLIGNRHGIVAGSRTSGPEMARIDNSFVFTRE
ncbi:translation initiation factor IF-6 [Candidatus Micrarchaeota archaeon]|nr:translation initiation factor IF-6 [Candidatus Micrarchaeota archaeon]